MVLLVRLLQGTIFLMEENGVQTPSIDQEKALKKRAHMLGSKIPRLVFEMSGPTVIAQLVSLIYSMGDTFFVSGISPTASAAVSIGFSLLSFLQAIGFGLGMGAGSLISMALGSKKKEEAETYASSALYLSLALGLILLVLGQVFLTPLMMAFGASETSIDMATSYGRYLFFMAPIFCANCVMNVCLRSEGNAAYAMWGMAIGGLLNFGLDPLFIYALGLGVSGAAIATLLSNAVSFLILAFPYLRKKAILSMKPSYVSFHFSTYRKILSSGFPTILRQGLASLASALLNNAGKPYGDGVVGAIGISYKTYLIGRQITIGIGQGYMPIAGYNYASGEKKRTKQAFYFSTFLASIVCLSVSLFMLLFPREIISLFQKDESVVGPGSQMLRFLAMSLPFLGYSTFVNQTYQCLGHSFWASILAALRQGIFFLPLVILFPYFWGLTGVGLVQPAADILTFLASIPFHIYFWKKYLSEPK